MRSASRGAIAWTCSAVDRPAGPPPTITRSLAITGAFVSDLDVEPHRADDRRAAVGGAPGVIDELLLGVDAKAVLDAPGDAILRDVGRRILERAISGDRILVAPHLRVVREAEHADEPGMAGDAVVDLELEVLAARVRDVVIVVR